ncbi:hypothetical protein H072_5878 [Dactylellina haptotyla CBS 200.50]|uniref:Uncharacterized protein n=1 Tax=Dactylellina haptotyla (strain CBS 200.50) TaxID=1284197 RepID=S8AGS9_DACHA|nr:hypothetical protein H072_5878 [Dactylellina haptotyla CBS 200.50]
MDDADWLYSDDGRQRFNASILKEFNYTIYPNDTISNFSTCVLAFGGYVPTVISNGSWYNSTGCDTPVRPIRTRGAIGVATAIIFAALLVMSLVCLSKHGKSFLPAEKRFRLVGRRWPWYWCIITSTVGLISGFCAVDVDRVWVLGTSAIFHFIFYMVSLPCCLAAIWEMSRNWGSFEERKGIDEDFFRYRQDDLRSKIEFYEPLIFYLFNFLSFFLSILRNWNTIARSNANVITDARFQASSILSFLAWMVIVVAHLIARHYYQPQKFPWKIPATILLILIRIAFNIGSAFEYSFSQLRWQATPAYIYCLGFLPVILVILVIIYSGLREPNEDQELLRFRNARNAILDQEMLAIKSPEKRKSTGKPRTIRTRRESRASAHDYWGSEEPVQKA